MTTTAFWLAYKLAKETGRTDVCALPSGVSVPHMFVVVFVIMLPIANQTGDPVKGWEAGLAWVLLQGFLLMIGGYIAPIIRKITPRAALLGTLAGVSVAFISLRPAMEMYMTPVIGVTCFAIVLVSWFGKVRYPKGIPAGLIAIAVGCLIAWGSTALGMPYGGMSGESLMSSFANFGFSLPIPAFDHTFAGFEYLGVILVTAIPFGIYDLVEAMDNVESAAAAGDDFPTNRVLTADGVISAPTGKLTSQQVCLAFFATFFAANLGEFLSQLANCRCQMRGGVGVEIGGDGVTESAPLYGGKCVASSGAD